VTPAATPLIPGALPLTRPLRADARRNRERVLKAAGAVFADQGIDAQMDDVARRAKVGVGTVYRHFPTKEALVEALVRARFGEIVAIAAEARERADAWQGFCELIWRAAELNAADRGFCEVMAMTDQRPVIAECGLSAHTAALMERAKAAGRMRADASEADVSVIMCGAGSVMRTMTDPDAWRRYLTLMLDGMRAA
jgi:AcrR family transcriptional regulator